MPLTLGRPLLVKGEARHRQDHPRRRDRPRARLCADSLAHQVHDQGAARPVWYDAVARLRDSQLGEARVHDIANYILRGKLWDAFVADQRPVLLIDEIDKADIDSRTISCTSSIAWSSTSTRRGRQSWRGSGRSSSSPATTKKELPDAFLRRCFPLHPLPRRGDHGAHHRGALSDAARRSSARSLERLYELREVQGPEEATLDVGAPRLDSLAGGRRCAQRCAAARGERGMPVLYGALLKSEQDVLLTEMALSQSRNRGRG